MSKKKQICAICGSELTRRQAIKGAVCHECRHKIDSMTPKERMAYRIERLIGE